MTFTQRGLIYPIGLQAILSLDDGETWDFQSDRIIIEGKTPWGMYQGGGFGNTLQLKDGGLISCYSYRAVDNKDPAQVSVGPGKHAQMGLTHVEVVRWRLPETASLKK